MEKIENIKIMNDLVLRTERGDLIWNKTEMAGFYSLNNSNGEIVVGKKRNSDIVFKISGEKGDSITNKNFRNNNNEDLQEYKVCNILWSLVKDTCSEKIIDFQEILNLLEEEEESEL